MQKRVSSENRAEHLLGHWAHKQIPAIHKARFICVQSVPHPSEAQLWLRCLSPLYSSTFCQETKRKMSQNCKNSKGLISVMGFPLELQVVVHQSKASMLTLPPALTPDWQWSWCLGFADAQIVQNLGKQPHQTQTLMSYKVACTVKSTFVKEPSSELELVCVLINSDGEVAQRCKGKYWQDSALGYSKRNYEAENPKPDILSVHVRRLLWRRKFAMSKLFILAFSQD